MAEREPDSDRRDTGFSSASRELPPDELTPRTPTARVPITTETDPYATPDDLFRGYDCLLYTSPSPRDGLLSRMPSSA